MSSATRIASVCAVSASSYATRTCSKLRVEGPYERTSGRSRKASVSRSREASRRVGIESD
eukprot:30860-Pelagococcus_subviridis.AAC.5